MIEIVVTIEELSSEQCKIHYQSQGRTDSAVEVEYSKKVIAKLEELREKDKTAECFGRD